MNPLTRFLRFNLVGLLGILVQLTTLAILNRTLPHHYLLTSTIAVELTLLHNFLWHLHYTWPQTPSPLSALLRFHLSNGLISLVGNLLLMRLLIHSAHLPILLANAIAIACCGIANFLLAHFWAFAKTQPSHCRPRFIRRLAAIVLLFSSTTLIAQTTALPHAPSPQTYQPSPSVSCLSNAGVLCGTGASTSPTQHNITFRVGLMHALSD
ncbi:MAG TPA: GtrA family protein [Bryocella sp.]|nr:GtrA family protein [Bryocella sp.]